METDVDDVDMEVDQDVQPLHVNVLRTGVRNMSNSLITGQIEELRQNLESNPDGQPLERELRERLIRSGLALIRFAIAGVQKKEMTHLERSVSKDGDKSVHKLTVVDEMEKSELQRQIDGLRFALRIKESEVEQLSANKEQNTLLKAEVKKKDAEIRALNKQLNELTTGLRQLNLNAHTTMGKTVQDIHDDVSHVARTTNVIRNNNPLDSVNAAHVQANTLSMGALKLVDDANETFQQLSSLNGERPREKLEMWPMVFCVCCGEEMIGKGCLSFTIMRPGHPFAWCTGLLAKAFWRRKSRFDAYASTYCLDHDSSRNSMQWQGDLGSPLS